MITIGLFSVPALELSFSLPTNIKYLLYFKFQKCALV